MPLAKGDQCFPGDGHLLGDSAPDSAPSTSEDISSNIQTDIFNTEVRPFRRDTVTGHALIVVATNQKVGNVNGDVGCNIVPEKGTFTQIELHNNEYQDVGGDWFCGLGGNAVKKPMLSLSQFQVACPVILVILAVTWSLM